MTYQAASIPLFITYLSSVASFTTQLTRTFYPSSSTFSNERSRISQNPFYMSLDEEEDGELPDELSKLIGKRASIAKRSSVDESTLQSSTSSETATESKENQIASLYEGKSGMDMFEMPEFQSKRPIRTPETKDPSRSPGGSGSEEKESESSYIDFMAEYDDENDDFHVPNRIGFGTKDWGDTSSGFRSGKKLKKKDIKRGKFLAGDLQIAYNKLMEAGIVLADSSEAYGFSSRKNGLSSEQILGRCFEENTDTNPLIATTMSNPWKSFLRLGGGVGGSLRFGRRGILKAIEASAERLGTSVIDLYQVPSHMFYLGLPNVVSDALIMALDQGLINNIGVCNLDKSSMKRFARKLSKRGYQLTSNQFEFSLTNRKAYKSGLIQTCKKLGVTPIAHTPLGGGLASGLYTNTNPTGGQVSGKQPFDFKTLDRYDVLHGMLDTVANKVKKRLTKENQQIMNRRDRYSGPPINTDVTTSQIAINYVVAKGCVPIVGIKNPREADELIACLGWGLTSEEVKMLDDAAAMCE